ncbi:MAG: DUF3750 domain-containing protein [Alphaproteobacteria bacterium]
MKWPAVVIVVFAIPILASLAGTAVQRAEAKNWWEARRDSSRQAPEPADEQRAVLQVYAARAYGWRGAFGVHTWIAYKPAGAVRYERVEVIGWGVRRGGPAIRAGYGTPDAYWFGSRPDLLVDLRGQAAADAIPRVQAAVARYPWPDQYRVWPGPNSNTFTAFVAREVPSLGLDLPANAVGKDFLNDAVFGPAPSGTGYQLSVFGLAGILVAMEEGVEINLLGLNLGLDLNRPALRLPGLGRVGF